jgi:YgiT-type zinc finger domain-containing protein
MKCTECHAAEPVTKYRGEVPYWYKGHTTTIHGVSQLVCLRCGYESIPPGHVQQWLEQTAKFRAEIDAQRPDQEPRPESLKDKIMVEWLDLDPDRLADGVQVEQGAYICWETLANYAKQRRNKVFEAFAGYKGSHTTDRPGCAYLGDWMEFLDALRKAREIAADPNWEAPRDGVVYHCLA